MRQIYLFLNAETVSSNHWRCYILRLSYCYCCWAVSNCLVIISEIISEYNEKYLSPVEAAECWHNKNLSYLIPLRVLSDIAIYYIIYIKINIKILCILILNPNQAFVTLSMETIYFPLVFPYKTKSALSYLSLWSTANLSSVVYCYPLWCI